MKSLSSYIVVEPVANRVSPQVCAGKYPFSVSRDWLISRPCQVLNSCHGCVCAKVIRDRLSFGGGDSRFLYLRALVSLPVSQLVDLVTFESHYSL